ncbi:MAG: CRTAC1 family protein [Bryobacteraceae bacterium]
MRLVCAGAWGSLLLLTISAALSLSAPEGIQFTDVAKTAGIRFTHYKGSHGVSTILEEAGPGVCVADFDGDGFEDIYFVNGRDLYGNGIEVRNALYRNNGNGTFADVTERAGVPGNAYGLGCIWGDYDNDGHPDLYVTQYGKNILYRNNGDGTFTDVTQKAHVDGTDFGTVFHTGATFFDYDRDGYLDLYAGGYVEFGPGSQRTCKIGFDVQASCAPSVYKGSPAVLYHNNRDGTFTNITKAAKIFQPNGKNLSIAAADYDNDGWSDLFVANDGIDVYLYHNEHNGTFKEVALTTGIALTANGNPMAAMCMSLGDYDNDGFLDLYVSDFQGAGDHIWHNDREGFLEEVSDRAGLTTATQGVLSFGGGFFDYDNDGRLDLFIANGHVYQGVEKTAPNIHYKQINSLFHNAGGGRFADVTTMSGSGFTTPYLGRGAAFADFDNDGYPDVVVGNNGDPPLLLHNNGATPGNHFVNFRLVGTRSNRDAMGTRIKVTSGGVSQIREITGGGSYLSQSDLRAQFGLGQQTRIESMEISWPSGLRQSFTGIDADRFYVVEEGKDDLRLQRF